MLTRRFLPIAAIAMFMAPAMTARADDAPSIPDLKVEKYTLPDGLEVILHEDYTTPIVGVNIHGRRLLGHASPSLVD